MDMINGKALCIGINKFKNYPENNLRGCVNDVENISKALLNIGISSENIYRLTDEQATKTNIINGLQYLVNESIKGNCSYIFLSLSSHGTRINSSIFPNSDVAAYVPTDVTASGNGWDPNYIISADEITQIISSVPTNVIFEAVIDCCHSGGIGIRDFDLQPNLKIRYLAPPSSPQTLSRSIIQVRSFRDTLSPENIDNHISWAACRNDQTAADAFINGTFNGAFSHSFCKTLNNSGYTLSRSSLLEQIQRTISQSFTQIPELHATPKQSSNPFGTYVETGATRMTGQNISTSNISIQNFPALFQLLWIIYKSLQPQPQPQPQPSSISTPSTRFIEMEGTAPSTGDKDLTNGDTISSTTDNPKKKSS